MPSTWRVKLARRHQFILIKQYPNHFFSNSNVVYNISCKDCDASYVGQIKRQLKTRIKEYSNNTKLNFSKHSIIFEHILQYSHTFDWDNVKILLNRIFTRDQYQKWYIKEQENDIKILSDRYWTTRKSYFGIFDQLFKF